MKIKEGVIMAGLQLEMRPVLKAADRLWKQYGEELVVTSALDGTHSAGSLHYYGLALDFRTRYFPDGVAFEASEVLQDALGPDFRVIYEGTHIHVQKVI